MKVTIIGVGGLGSALAAGLVDAGADISLTLCARKPLGLEAFAGRARLLFDTREAVADADVVVLAVKPKGTPELLAHLSPALPKDAVVVSCAAGVTLARLVGHPVVARAMPNIGAQQRASTTALCFGSGCLMARDRPRLTQVFAAVGAVREIADEGLLHVVTAVGASGPAFVLLACEALADAAVEQGLSRNEALAWARAAVVAAAARLGNDGDGIEPQAVRAQVTSPAGTTAAGLAALESHTVRAAFCEAVRAATQRSREMG
ncbi:MAG: pyrroline-5-carboxylate reductase [Deltaproteobacteria bacterium]|nr:pyrroline-5-carboxylate reductase [Deltaproteobacteria bacterium]